ncbi:hypothetical protein BT63DRAFT_188332 [Microthyrium microscopicum]|uniref:Uncharacterized protein n=1 Tax=Microthyrium microscopicum TaxID=703497 RepID=A0A6A6UIS7_9PEZI|nr:hypothetical protein BT63DRAFT_188332 [Microthyrium microscopicum]
MLSSHSYHQLVQKFLVPNRIVPIMPQPQAILYPWLNTTNTTTNITFTAATAPVTATAQHMSNADFNIIILIAILWSFVLPLTAFCILHCLQARRRKARRHRRYTPGSNTQTHFHNTWPGHSNRVGSRSRHDVSYSETRGGVQRARRAHNRFAARQGQVGFKVGRFHRYSDRNPTWVHMKQKEALQKALARVKTDKERAQRLEKIRKEDWQKPFWG